MNASRELPAGARQMRKFAELALEQPAEEIVFYISCVSSAGIRPLQGTREHGMQFLGKRFLGNRFPEQTDIP